VGGPRGTHAGEEKCFRNFGRETKKRELKTQPYEPAILQGLKKQDGRSLTIRVLQDRAEWRAVVIAVMNLRVS
jgi:hypothetical protein